MESCSNPLMLGTDAAARTKNLRIGQAANIFGTTAGQVPGAPVQPFAGNPYLQGIGTFAGLQGLLGARGAGLGGYAQQGQNV